jgi:hypothetical protein
MLIGQKGVKYGLDVRAPPGAKPAAKAALAKKPSVFGDNESDDDQEQNVEKQIARQAARKQSDKKVCVVLRAVGLDRDPYKSKDSWQRTWGCDIAAAPQSQSPHAPAADGPLPVKRRWRSCMQRRSQRMPPSLITTATTTPFRRWVPPLLEWIALAF